MRDKLIYTTCVHAHTFRSYDSNMVPTDKGWNEMTYAEQKTLQELYEPLKDLVKRCTDWCPR